MAWAKILLPWQLSFFFHVHLNVEFTASQVLLHRPKQVICHEMCFSSMTAQVGHKRVVAVLCVGTSGSLTVLSGLLK